MPSRAIRSGGLWPALQYVSRPSPASVPYTHVANRDCRDRRIKPSLTDVINAAAESAVLIWAAKIP